MTSLSGSRPVGAYEPQPSARRSIFLVIGMACLAAFTSNFFIVAIPPDPMALEWRLTVMRSISGYSIVLFLGFGLVLYGLTSPSMRRVVALLGLVIGLMFLLSGVLVIRDSLILRNQAVANLEQQADTIREQIQAAESSPDLPPEITPQRIAEAKQQLASQTEALTLNARQSTNQAMISVLGAQVVAGVGLIALGRLGIKHCA